MASRGNGFNNNRGRGRGRGRGASVSRGQPRRGWTMSGRGDSRGRGSGRAAYNNLDIIDVDIQRYADETPAPASASPVPQPRGRGSYRSRGRGRATSTALNLQVFTNGRNTPLLRREDWDSKAAVRRQSRGLGAKYHYDMPLSKLLAMDRPYLRPINFVPAQLTPVLFQHEEDLIEVHEFTVESEDHVPTAEQVSRVFNQQGTHPSLQDSFFQDPKVDLLEAADSEPVVTVDFASLGKLFGGASTPQSSLRTGTEQLETNPKVTNAPESEVPENGQALNAFDTIMQALSINSKEPTNATSCVTGPEGHIDNTSSHSHVEEVTSAAASQESTKRTKEVNRNQKEKAEEQPSFVVDPSPSRPSEQRVDVKYASAINNSQPLGSTLHDDEEVIVYDAPLRRSGRTTPSVSGAADRPPAVPSTIATHLSVTSGASRPTTVKESTLVSSGSTKKPAPVTTGAFAGMSFSFDPISQVAEINREQTASPRARRLTKRDRKNRAAKRNGKRRSSFGTFGALLEERYLHEDDLGLNSTRGKLESSDIDWGDGDDEADEIEAVSSSLGGMDIDGDLDMKAMQSFVDGMSKEGMEHTTIDDIEVAEKLRLEDESSNEDQDVDSEVEIVLKDKEERLVGEANGAPESTSEPDEPDDDDVSSDEEEMPMQNFQARLTRVRQSAKEKRKMKEPVSSAAQGSNGNLFGGRMSGLRSRGNQTEEESEDDGDHDDSDDFGAEEQDEDYLDDLQDLVDEEDDIFMSDKKQRKAFFKAVLNGDFSSAPAKKKRDYGKDLPPKLREQWEKDRAKKAENKRKRVAARLQVAADPFAKHKGGKKGRKAMLRAARLAEEAREEAPPNAGPDIAVLVHQMRMYLDDLSLTGPMALPPMDKGSRAKIHEIAAAFGLKSQSKGKGDARYTTLIKTSRSGIQIEERKIERILSTGGNWGFTRPGNPGGGKGKGSGTPKHREGDEVGKAAPKIGESNIGFRMLAQMGWAEGEKIGISGGLDAPVKAIIKNSKLGLGATR